MMLQKRDHEGTLKYHSPIELKCSELVSSLTFFSPQTQMMIANYYKGYFVPFMKLTQNIKLEHLEQLRQLE
jgi:hypothetical protein